ncbi:hypothetical protein D3C72_1379600 [compost metagenome]
MPFDSASAIPIPIIPIDIPIDVEIILAFLENIFFKEYINALKNDMFDLELLFNIS